MSWHWFGSLALLIGAAVALNGAETKLQEARGTLERWVETRQLIEKTKSDWHSDKELLEQTRQLFERESNTLLEQRSSLSTNSTQVEKERLQGEQLLRDSDATLDRARELATRLERELVELLPRLPMPLQELLKPLINRMPSDPGATRMSAGERVQVIVGALNEIDKFSSAVTIFNEKRKNGNGDEVAVDTVYLGLGAAYFVNSSGDLAGVGIPGAKGWEWEPQPQIASAVQEVIRIYRNERSARFVPLPAVIR